MKILKELLQNQSLDFFLDKHFTRLPFSSVAGAKSYVHLLNWEILEEIIDSKKAILRVVRDGVMTRDHAQFSFNEARNYYGLGHTLLVKNAERAFTAHQVLAHDFSQSFYTEVDVQLYCTPNDHNAFGWHYDVEEVFIIQAKGSKIYSIRPNTHHPKPLVSSISKDQGYENEKSDIEIKVLLEEGDWLYIPSGWWHVAKTQRESMHISIGLMPRSAVDIVSYLNSYVARDPFWRSRLPVHQKFESETDEITFYQDAFESLGKDLQNKLKDPAFILSFLNHSRKN